MTPASLRFLARGMLSLVRWSGLLVTLVAAACLLLWERWPEVVDSFDDAQRARHVQELEAAVEAAFAAADPATQRLRLEALRPVLHRVGQRDRRAPVVAMACARADRLLAEQGDPQAALDWLRLWSAVDPHDLDAVAARIRRMAQMPALRDECRALCDTWLARAPEVAPIAAAAIDTWLAAGGAGAAAAALDVAENFLAHDRHEEWTLWWAPGEHSSFHAERRARLVPVCGPDPDARVFRFDLLEGARRLRLQLPFGTTASVADVHLRVGSGAAVADLPLLAFATLTEGLLLDAGGLFVTRPDAPFVDFLLPAAAQAHVAESGCWSCELRARVKPHPPPWLREQAWRPEWRALVTADRAAGARLQRLRSDALAVAAARVYHRRGDLPFAAERSRVARFVPSSASGPVVRLRVPIGAAADELRLDLPEDTADLWFAITAATVERADGPRLTLTAPAHVHDLEPDGTGHRCRGGDPFLVWRLPQTTDVSALSIEGRMR